MTAQTLSELGAAVDRLSLEVGRFRDVEAIRRLHFTYGYCMDKWLFDDIVDLFAEDCVLNFMNGIFKGRAGAQRMYGWTRGVKGPQDGQLGEHIMAQEVIDIAPDGQQAFGRFRCFLQGGIHESKAGDYPPGTVAQFWEAGVYENTYVKRDGVWQIKIFNYRIAYQSDYEHGWAHSPIEPLVAHNFEGTFPEDPYGPDELRPVQPQWPSNRLMPFHYPHPVTGAEIGAEYADR